MLLDYNIVKNKSILKQTAEVRSISVPKERQISWKQISYEYLRGLNRNKRLSSK